MTGARPTVGFTRMQDGTAEDYALLVEIEQRDLDRFADRVLDWLRAMDVPAGYRVTRLEHSLQATVDFCANYDQCSFDPDYDWLPLTFFEPMVREVLARPAFGTM